MQRLRPLCTRVRCRHCMFLKTPRSLIGSIVLRDARSRRKSRCKDCGGSGLCKHGRRKVSQPPYTHPYPPCNIDRQIYRHYSKHGCRSHFLTRTRHLVACLLYATHQGRCKLCGGNQICSHGRRRTHCKACGGTGLCSHGRQKSRCKECGDGEDSGCVRVCVRVCRVGARFVSLYFLFRVTLHIIATVHMHNVHSHSPHLYTRYM